MKSLSFLVVGLLLGAAQASASTFTQTVIFDPVLQVDDGSDIGEASVTVVDTVLDLNVTLDFTKCDDPISSSGACIGPGTPYFNEIGFTITSPSGTTVDLVLFDTFPVGTVGDRFEVKFDDSAPTDFSALPLPMSGTYKPAGTLSDFIGETTFGVWTVTFSDSFVADPLSLNVIKLEFNAPIPVPAALPMLGGALAAVYGLRRRQKRA